MKFKGDIIITDPCYICRDKDYDERKIDERPKEKDYYIYGHDIEKYPDAVEEIWDYSKESPEMRDMLERMDKIIEGAKPGWLKNNPRMHWVSKMYDECDKKYWDAVREYSNANADDWEKCSYGENMEELGIHTYICRDTLYGDWSCTTYDSDTKEKLGEFCADAGMVGVFLLDEVMKYNPDFDYHINRPWTTTLIKDFDGEVDFEIVETSGVYEEDTEWYKKGEEWTDREVSVIGKGNINFETHQTGL